jgi:hypothetical protein
MQKRVFHKDYLPEPTLFQKRNKVQAPRAGLSCAHNKKEKILTRSFIDNARLK